ncbi:hypothetical protein EGR_10350 [Echinococcus granulosus]|uniref:Uncharacterized protein n=1 Tax=Echinococcus granulosus TaxID=6210 RepID=W6U8K4_ECHGR|nr:hypothetical protein EGR_10350 [Echinococcus granulosus]EUB54797.1 hypothetical protein EGR_10350 [Echinococcus granulosus]
MNVAHDLFLSSLCEQTSHDSKENRVKAGSLQHSTIILIHSLQSCIMERGNERRRQWRQIPRSFEQESSRMYCVALKILRSVFMHARLPLALRNISLGLFGFVECLIRVVIKAREKVDFRCASEYVEKQDHTWFCHVHCFNR